MNEIPSPIALTPEQHQQIYNQRAQHFMDGMQKLTEETGLVLMPEIQYSEHGPMIRLALVDKTRVVDKPSVPLV